MLQLHYFPSTASMIPHILLEELGVPYERVLVDRSQNVQKTMAFLRLNPNGLIPVLTDGDLVLYETAAICLHLCDTHPEAEMAPPLGSAERAHFYKWLMWLSNTLQPTLSVWFYPERWVHAGNSGCAEQVRHHAELRANTLLKQIDHTIGEQGQPWLLGERYSALAPYVFTLCRWTRGFQSPARSKRHLGAYLERLLERPAVQRVLASEELAPPYV